MHTAERKPRATAGTASYQRDTDRPLTYQGILSYSRKNASERGLFRQSVHVTFNHGVVGSSPTALTKNQAKQGNGVPDPLTIASGISTAKTAFDTLRAAIGLLNDTKNLLPKDEKTATITAALATAESSSRIAEAEVAKALGYELCKCQFPPTPMLTVGYFDRPVAKRQAGDPVYECP